MNTKPMKIAYLGIKGLPSKGGAERVVEAVVKRSTNGFRPVVYCDKNYTPAETQMPGVDFVRLPCLRGKYTRSLSLFILSAFHALLFGDYSVVHLHNSEACFIAPLLKLKYPIIGTNHGPAYERSKWNKLAKTLLRAIDYLYISVPNLLTSVSLPITRYYQSTFEKSVVYIPNGIDHDLPVDDEGASSTLKQYDVHSDYILFAAGRMDPTKGCHFLLEAFSDIKCDLNLVVIGDSRTDAKYSRELWQIADARVRFIPFIGKKEELFGIFRKARFFVFPSTVEAMSMALLEAASLGLPVICSDIPANLAVLPEHALHFRSADVGDLQTKLAWAIDHPEEMTKLGIKAREWVREEFSWDVIAEKYMALYRDFQREPCARHFDGAKFAHEQSS